MTEGQDAKPTDEWWNPTLFSSSAICVFYLRYIARNELWACVRVLQYQVPQMGARIVSFFDFI